MAQGFLSLFDDPVAGPQLALGALSTGIGLLTARKPRDVNRALQGGISELSNVFLYSGQQQQKRALEEQEEAERAAAFQRFKSLAGPGGPGLQGIPGVQSGGSPVVSMSNSQPAPAAVNGGGGGLAGLTPEEALELAIQYPDMRPALMPRIKQYGEAPKLSEVEQFQQMGEAAGLKPAQIETALQRKLGAIPSAGSEMTISATEKYRKLQEERRNRTAAEQNADRDAKFAFEKSRPAAQAKPPAPLALERKLAAAGIQPGTPEYIEAFKREAGLIQDTPRSYAPLPIERSLELEGIKPGTPEYIEAVRAARPRAGSADPIDKLVDDISREGGGSPGDPLVEPVSPAVPETTLTEDLQNLIPTPGPESVPGANPALGGASPIAPPPQPAPPPAPTLGEKEDVRLEKRLGADKAAALRTMLAGITEPAKQRRAQGVLRRMAKGTLGINAGADELEAMGL